MAAGRAASALLWARLSAGRCSCSIAAATVIALPVPVAPSSVTPREPASTASAIRSMAAGWSAVGEYTESSLKGGMDPMTIVVSPDGKLPPTGFDERRSGDRPDGKRPGGEGAAHRGGSEGRGGSAVAGAGRRGDRGTTGRVRRRRQCRRRGHRGVLHDPARGGERPA